MKSMIQKISASKTWFFVLVLFMLSFSFLGLAEAAPDGCSKDVGHNCDEWDFSNWPNSVAQYTCKDNNDVLGDYLYTLGSHSRADIIRGNVAIPLGWGDACSIDCGDSNNCGNCECRCQGSGLYCADKFADTSNRIVAQSCRVEEKAASCIPLAKITTYSVTNGTCGTRSDNYSATQVPPYAHNTTAWPAGSAYCSSGTNSASPAFPPQGGNVSWDCAGGNVNFSGIGGDPSENSTIEYQWVIRTHANNTSKNYSQDIVISGPTGSFSRTLPSNSYYVFFRVKTHALVWSNWVYVSITVKSPASCSASRDMITGACGANSKTYVSTTTAWPSTAVTAWCSTGIIAGSAPVFPATPGTNVSWKCNGSDSTKTTDDKTCYAYRLAEYGCGTRQDMQPYAANVTAWPAGLSSCSSGASNPVNPVFPAQPGNDVTWTCPSGAVGIIGVGSEPIPCLAHRNKYMCQGTVPDNAAACGSDQVTHDLAWKHVSACSLGECEFVCKDGYTWNDTAKICQQNTAVSGCGTADRKIYPYTANDYGATDTFCDDGIFPNPKPKFPDPGQIVSWTCDGGQTDCSATKQRDLNWKEIAPSN